VKRLLPQRGDELLLSVPQSEQVLARVDDDGPGWFDLTLLELPATPPALFERTTLMVEFINDDGVARLHGRLDTTGRRPSDMQEIVRFAHRGSPQLLRRREYVRATVALPLELTLADDDEPTVNQAQALDISGGGMLVNGIVGARVGETVTFALQLDEDRPPVRGSGRVARVLDGYRAGIQFDTLDEADRIQVTQMAFEMSREQRRRIT